jgi:hypothetical protein
MHGHQCAGIRTDWEQLDAEGDMDFTQPLDFGDQGHASGANVGASSELSKDDATTTAWGNSESDQMSKEELGADDRRTWQRGPARNTGASSEEEERVRRAQAKLRAMGPSKTTPLSADAAGVVGINGAFGGRPGSASASPNGPVGTTSSSLLRPMTYLSLGGASGASTMPYGQYSVLKKETVPSAAANHGVPGPTSPLLSGGFPVPLSEDPGFGDVRYEIEGRSGSACSNPCFLLCT